MIIIWPMNMIRYTFLFLVTFMCSILPAQNALDFDGTNDAVNCGTGNTLNITGNALSIEAWIYPTAWKTQIFEGTIVIKENNSNNTGFMFRAGAGGKLNFALGSGTGGWQELTTSNNVLDTGKWQHVVATYDGSKSRLYVDGVQVDSMSVSISIGSTSSTPLSIGYHPIYGRNWQGRIDEVRLWSKTLTLAEIKANERDEFCYTQSGLRAYYKFNHGTASGNNGNVTSLVDYSGNNNTGTLTNFALTGSSSNWVSGASLSRDSVNHSDTFVHCGNYFDPARSVLIKQSGVVNYLLKTSGGCDSILSRYYEILPLSSSSINAFACDSFVGPKGNAYYSSGTYIEKLSNAYGCDSTITLNLEIGVDTGQIDTTVCYNYLDPAGTNHTAGGSFFAKVQSAKGCDSLIAINLTVLSSSFSSQTIEFCHSLTSPSGKYTYTSPGAYYDTITSSLGCDSVLQLTLIDLSTFASINPAQCDPYTTPKGQVLTQSGTYNETLVNKRFCDSFLTINYTRYSPDSNGINLFGCRSVMSVNGIDEFQQSGTYRASFTNQYGCDSLITMVVTVHHVNKDLQDDGTHLSALSSSGTFRWLDCDANMDVIPNETNATFKPATFGTYAVEVTEMTCVDTSDCLNFHGTAIPQIGNDVLRIYPNPSTGSFVLESEAGLSGVTLKIFNSAGQLVMTKKLRDLSQAKIETNLVQGIYLLEVSSEQGIWRNKLVITHN